MRVLILHNRYREPGGEDAVVDGEIAVLRRAGEDVHVLQWSNDEVRTDGPLHMGMAFASAIWNPTAWRKVRRAVEDFSPDVAHIHNTHAAASPAIVHASAAPGVGIVHTLHNFRHLCLNGLLLREGSTCTDCVGRFPWRGVTRACYRGQRSASAAVACGEAVHRALGSWNRVNRFIALSDHARGLHIQAGFTPGRIVVKPQTLDVDPGLGDHCGGFALFVGRLSVEKGIHVLLNAWTKVGLDLELVIAGDGAEAGHVRSIVAGLPRAKMLGGIPRDQVIALMRDARILVMPSLCFENFPVTLLEGLATGCPIIASDIGALGEIIRHGENGVLVPPGDVAALGRALVDLDQAPDERARLSQGARASFVERYSPERACAALLVAYREACAEAGRHVGAYSAADRESPTKGLVRDA